MSDQQRDRITSLMLRVESRLDSGWRSLCWSDPEDVVEPKPKPATLKVAEPPPPFPFTRKLGLIGFSELSDDHTQYLWTYFLDVQVKFTDTDRCLILSYSREDEYGRVKKFLSKENQDGIIMVKVYRTDIPLSTPIENDDDSTEETDEAEINRIIRTGDLCMQHSASCNGKIRIRFKSCPNYLVLYIDSPRMRWVGWTDFFIMSTSPTF